MEYSFKNSKHNDQKRANKNNRLSDSIVDYEDVALEYFKDLDGNLRCALSGEILQEDNLSKEHIIALAIGGHDIATNIVPTAIGYNVIKNDMYILSYLMLQRNQAGEKIYNPYRLLKMVNYMLKSINARGTEIDEYKKTVLIPNDIDEYLRNIERNHKQVIYPEKNAPKKGEARKIERNSQEIEYEGEGITIYTFICDAINKLKDEGVIPEEFIKYLKNILENTKETDVFRKLDIEAEMRKEIIKALRDRNIGNEYDIAYILQKRVSSKEEVERKLDATLKHISELLKQNGINEEWAGIILENRPELLINMDEISKINKTIEFYAKQTELSLEFFKSCFSYNKTAREYIEIFKKLREKGIDLTKIKKGNITEIFLKKQGYDIETIGIQGIGELKNIGQIRDDIRKGRIKTTEEEINILLDLGIVEEIHIKKLKGVVERINFKSAKEHIEIFKKLKEKGLDLTQIKTGDTMKSFLERQEYDIETIGIEGIGELKNIGQIRDDIRGGTTKTTEEERGLLLELGILEEVHIKKLEGAVERRKYKSVSEYIEMFKSLKEKGVDLTKIKTRDTLRSFLEKQGYDIETIGIEGIEELKNIGHIRNRIKNGIAKTTEKERNILLELGMLEEADIRELEGIVEKIKPKSAKEHIGIFKKLKEKGLDLTQIKTGDTMKSFLEKQGYDIEIIGIEEIKEGDSIGKTKGNLKSGLIKTTEKERNILLELGILEEVDIKKLKGVIERKMRKSAVEYIEIFKQLKEKGLDLKRIRQADTLKSFLEKQGYDIETIGIEGLEELKNIGQIRNDLRGGSPKTTEEEREMLLSLGILEEEHVKKLKQKDEEKAVKTMKKTVAKSAKDNEETRRNIQEQIMGMHINTTQHYGQYASIGR